MQRILVDWLEFTLLRGYDIKWIADFFCISLDDFEDLPKGGLGYKKQKFFNNIRLYYDGNIGMGLHIVVSGQGCRYLESQGKNLFDMIDYLYSLDNINLSRLDLALDTDFDILTKVLKSIEKDLYSSKSRRIKVISSLTDSKLKADTLYIGSRSSLLMVRIYNKAIEQGVDFVWYRVEIVLKKDRFEMIVPFLRQNISNTFAGVLTNYFRPLQSLKGQKCRSPTANYWVKFLGEIEKITLYSNPQCKTIEDKYAWLVNQVEPTIALLSTAFEGNDWLNAVVENGKQRLKEKDFKLLQKWKEVKYE
ncbi:replication initiation factor domain-containing protein [Peptoniphilus lacrimalis]|uniref:replication initiation factor domain-containing protein n=1 Tax=Peptoniphilus lacrimalis TaxID=33031 RepID=UPI0023F73D9D|nr:replication initiation factor domain-containing protein [Peptoniphilus lacrimalis]